MEVPLEAGDHGLMRRPGNELSGTSIKFLTVCCGFVLFLRTIPKILDWL